MRWTNAKSIFSLIIFMLLSCVNNAFSSECQRTEMAADGISIESDVPSDMTNPLAISNNPEMLSQGDSIYSPEVESFIKETELSHAAGLPDVNENVEALSAFLTEMNKVKESIKKRAFGEEIDTEGVPVDKWLDKGEKHLLSLSKKYPESRYVFEGLGRIYKELYECTRDKKFIEKAADAFIQAEKLTMKHGIGGVPHYVQEMSDALATLGNRDRLDSYFTMVIQVFPDNGFVYLHYAKGLSRLNDKRADEFFGKAISLRELGNFQPNVDYAEHLLDRGMNEEAVGVLQQLSPYEDDAYYPHFLKGFALEKMGRFKEAGEEYKKYLGFRDSATDDEAQFLKYMFRAPSKYRIPGSELQKGIPFKEERSTSRSSAIEGTVAAASTVYRDTSPYCSPDDWICKAIYYIVWTINGEAERGGGTIGMMRAVAWNMRTRAFWNYAAIVCGGVSYVCTNYAANYPYTPNDVASLARRYYYVITTGSYMGLTAGTYTALSEQVLSDVIVNAKVPDPTAGACFPYGNRTVTGDSCSGTCGYAAGLWDSFRQSQSSNEFRGGQLVYKNVSFGCQIATLVPTSTPTGGTCGSDCYKPRGVICPRMGYPKCMGTCSAYCDMTRYGWVSKSQMPVYGNFFWHF